jgi:radical SAM family uncharacterized protein
MTDIARQISDQLLPRVNQPSQYVGLEVNARRKSLDEAEVAVALAFPDAYTVGISHLGGQVLYQMLNDMPNVACDRTYCPRPDAEAVMRECDIPLFGWESRSPLGEFDVIGFSLPYEICATNVLTMLDRAGVPLRAQDRRDEHPLIVGGDALADSPEPLAAFFDAFVAGDGEEPLRALVELVARAKKSGASREEMLAEAARTIPGLYVPHLYRPRYDDAGRYRGLEPLAADLPATIERAAISELACSPVVDRPLVPLAEGVQERVVIEVMRGCPNACRFCQAGAVRLPVRLRSVDEIVHAAHDAVAATGFTEVSLLSLSTSDFPNLTDLLDRLNAELGPRHVSISLPSLRVDTQLRELPRLTSGVRKGGLTIAAEAGSERLRRAIRKRITESDMIEGVRAAFASGFKSVKVYFMAGLPGERPEDVDEIVYLCRRLSDVRREVDGHRGAITASVSWFVPKPHTPMQWEPMRDEEYFWYVRNRLRDLSQRSTVSVRFHRIERSVLEGVLCRGDRRLADMVEHAWRAGARMDAWDEHWNWQLWLDAMAATGIDPAAVAQTPLEPDEPTPWSHIQGPRSHGFLLAERDRMMAELENDSVDRSKTDE